MADHLVGKDSCLHTDPSRGLWRTTAPGLADSVVAVGKELLERVFIDGGIRSFTGCPMSSVEVPTVVLGSLAEIFIPPLGRASASR